MDLAYPLGGCTGPTSEPGTLPVPPSPICRSQSTNSASSLAGNGACMVAMFLMFFLQGVQGLIHNYYEGGWLLLGGQGDVCEAAAQYIV